jgi:predicted N-acetyltransferase YhbS
VCIRDEEASDVAAIAELVREAFASAEHSSGTEAAIVSGLREAGALTASLVAVEDEAIVGHVVVSPVSIVGAAGWFGLGPVSVRPACQGRGICGALIEAALGRLKQQAAAGCVVLGDPGYYGRFGFAHRDGLSYRDIPPPYLQAISFGRTLPHGEVSYHEAFSTA